jgi:CRP-like cAMP-binding protein
MRSENRLLAALTAEDRQRWAGKLQRVPLASGDVLSGAGTVNSHVYFPESGLASILAVTANGGTVGIANIGNEGLVGWPPALDWPSSPQQVVVQVPGVALRVRADLLDAAFKRSTALRDLLLAHTLTLIAQISQSVVCHRFHTVPQRLARWLLVVRDCAPCDTLDLTQGAIARVLGIPRTGVTEAAGELKDAGVIWYRHGRIAIVDRKRLEREACDCHRGPATPHDCGRGGAVSPSA